MIQNNQEIKSKATAISHLVKNIQVDAPGFSSEFSPGFYYLMFQDKSILSARFFGVFTSLKS